MLKKSDRTRLHLLNTALKAFQERGYDACTMRDLAQDAGVTAPAFYYYFRSKEELVSAFYHESLNEHLDKAESSIKKGRPLTENLKTIIQLRFVEFSGNREVLKILKRFAFDKESELSPFHSSHRNIRKSSVDLFVKLIESSSLKWPIKSQRSLAQLLWLYHLLILFYWIGDESHDQKKTHELSERSLSHLGTMLTLLKLPGAQRVLNSIFETLKRARLLEEL
jgi:AcrR family transcriptional regulator